MQIVRLTPSGILPVVAFSELALAPPDNPGEPPRPTGRYCWAVYHGEPGPLQWRARIAVVGLPVTANRVNMAAPLLDEEFDLTVEPRRHADGKPHERPKLTLTYCRRPVGGLSWLVLCDPMPPFGWAVHFDTVGSVSKVDTGSASYGAWAATPNDDEIQRFPLPIYRVSNDAQISWITFPTEKTEGMGDIVSAAPLRAAGYLGKAAWNHRNEEWTASYVELTADEVRKYKEEFRLTKNGSGK